MASQYDLLLRDLRNQATLYDYDGVSNPRSLALVVGKAPYVLSMGADPSPSLFMGRTAVPLATWQVIYAPTFALSWFVVAGDYRPSVQSLMSVVPAYALMAVPLTLAWWLPRITRDTPGATPSEGRDQIRGQSTTFEDGTYGIGWQATQNGVLRSGYLAPISLRVGILDNARQEEWTEGGISLYEGPLVQYVPPIALTKGDLLIMKPPDSRRFVVGDMVTPIEAFGTVVLQSAKLEARNPGDISYQVPSP